MHSDCIFNHKTTTRLVTTYAVQHPSVLVAADAAGDALRELAGVNLSRTPGDPRTFDEFWLGQLRFLLGNLLVAIGDCDV